MLRSGPKFIGSLASSSDDDFDADEWAGFSSNLEEGMEIDSSNAKFEAAATYQPPHTRVQISSTTKLHRSLKGLFNRLSEQNMDNILKEVESLYQKHSRNDVTTTISVMIIEGTRSSANLLESYVALHSAFLGCLHRLRGPDVSAHLVQNVVTDFENNYRLTETEEENSADSSTSKECSNMLTLLGDLYMFGVISCIIIYDIIRKLLGGDLREADVELLLRLIRACGVQLRQDDPSALKDILQIVQTKVALKQTAPSSRTKFMVETLVHLKNNKLKERDSSSGVGASKERLMKFVNGVGKRHHIKHEPLQFTLQDLQDAESKGRWWVVGAAWGGDPLLDRSREGLTKAEENKDSDNKLLKLARQQGMNTDVRRSIFVILMSSADYLDACERLGQLKLKEIQQRDIMRVLIHCCGNEKIYNPYYALIGHRLCQQSHCHKITLQFCFWDFLRSIGESYVGGTQMMENLDGDDIPVVERVSTSRMRNIATAYAWWVTNDSVSITIMKALDLFMLKSKTRDFIEQLFVNLFAICQDSSLSPLVNVRSSLGGRNTQLLRAVLSKAARTSDLVGRLKHFFSTPFKIAIGESGEYRQFVDWSRDSSLNILRTISMDGDMVVDCSRPM